MAVRRVDDPTGGRWIDWQEAAAAQQNGRADEVLARWQGEDANRRAVVDVVGKVFRSAPTVRSAHEWAERIVELHYPDALSRERRCAVQALRLHTLQGVTVGWNTALQVLLMSDGLVTTAAEGVAAQRYADEIFLAVVEPDPGGATGRGGSRSSGPVGGDGTILPRRGNGSGTPESRARAA